jgi:hypothetical protein
MEECLTVDFNERPSFEEILPKLENCVIPDHLEVNYLNFDKNDFNIFLLKYYSLLTKSHIQIHKDDEVYQTLNRFESSNSNQNKSDSNYVPLNFDPKNYNQNMNSLKKKTLLTKISLSHWITNKKKTKTNNGSSYVANNDSVVVSINSTPIKEENKSLINNAVTDYLKNNDSNENISPIKDIPSNDNNIETSKSTVKERYSTVSDGKSFLIDVTVVIIILKIILM